LNFHRNPSLKTIIVRQYIFQQYIKCLRECQAHGKAFFACFLIQFYYIFFNYIMGEWIMVIDLRSDTVTRPTPAMRKAMAKAEVGDDVFGEDPTVNILQEKIAAMLGKEAGLFMASGTMSNQVAVKTHTQPGDEVVCDKECHIFNYECGMPAAFSGVQLHPLLGKNGFFSAEEVEQAVRPSNVHHPQTRLVWLENTHNRAGGTICPVELAEAVREVVVKHGLAMHLDGARLWNASVATGVPLQTYASRFDSVSVCFSKGLGAPVGSMLVGTREFIAKARRYRKMMGGGMRQAGVLAAAALYAVEHHVQRLSEDHRNARRFAEAAAELTGVSVDLDTVETNIVLIRLVEAKLSAREMVQKLKERNVLMLDTGPDRLRAVFHLDVTEKQTQSAVYAFQNCFRHA
jgi:threonine aldolase